MQKKILVVGAGPAGLVAAITLARAGVPTVLLERRSSGSPFPRATGISLRSMELLRSWGLEEQIRAGEMDVEFSGWVCDTLAAADGFPAPLGFPSRELARTISPTTAVAAPQDHLESVLLQHLGGLPGAEIRFGAELLAIDQHPDGVRVQMRTGGVVSTEAFDYVIGADGANSTVRGLVGIPMEGPDDLAEHYTVLFRAPLRAVVGPRRFGLYMVQHPGAAGVFVPADHVDRWVYSQPWDPSTESLADYPQERLVALIRAGAGAPDLPVRILRTGAFTFAARVAQRYREGRAFLVGDAAHRITPRGGTGMNTAIQDGYGLAWRLGWVLRGWADPSILDSYEQERRPAGIRNAERSARTEPRDTSADYLDDLDGRIRHAWLCHDDGLVSTLDLLGSGLTLLTGPAGRAWAAAAADLATVRAGGPGAPMPLTVHGVDEATAETLGLGRDGAVLVRPDGRPVRVWPTAGADELATAVLAQTTAPVSSDRVLV